MALNDPAYSQEVDPESTEWEGDLTDKQNKHFRYLG